LFGKLPFSKDAVMVRDALCLGVCAALLFGSTFPAFAGSGDEPDARIRNQLAVQSAFTRGLELIGQNNFGQAVVILEAQLPYIDGNSRYLTALRDAYKGHILALRRANRQTEADGFLARLEILDPEARRQLLVVTPATPPGVPPGIGNREERSPATTIPTAPPAVVPAAAPLAALASESRPTAQPDRQVGSPGIRGRGKLDMDENSDPFHLSNTVINPIAVGLVDRAERAYAGKHFDEARHLFEEAYRSDPSATRDCRSRWAYCRLVAVANLLTRGDGQPVELEREVRTAMELAPREMDGFGRDLLRKLAESAASAARIEVKHTPRVGNGWAVAETRSFRIFHTQSQEIAEQTARIAESTRLSMSRKWFEDEATTPWSPRCDIYLYANAKDYAHSTGAPPESPGHSTLSLDNGRIISRKIDLHCDDPNMLSAVLPHEATHVVLAGRFGLHHVPRWADEGMAVLAEPQDRIGLHLRNLPMHRSQNELFEAGKLLEMTNYPESRLIGAFYAESVSLVDFLSRRKSPAVFARFVRDGLETGYEAALRKHYHINSTAELDRLWRDQTFSTGVASTSSGKK
jgi:hypothetical protein